MTEPAVIQAVYADFKLIKTRSCLQLVFEVPVERATEALAIFGVPNHLTDVHVAIARLDMGSQPLERGPCRGYGGSAASSAVGARTEMDERPGKVDTTKSERAKASYRMSDDGERAVTRACSWRKLPKYWQFLKRFGHDVTNSAEAREGQLYAVGVATMAEVKSDPAAFQRFWDHETEWKIFNGELAQPR